MKEGNRFLFFSLPKQNKNKNETNNNKNLMHVVRVQRLQPESSKIKAFQNATIPTTKKQVRCGLDLIGFYQKFMSNVSAIATHLSGLNKKGKVKKVKWMDTEQHVFYLRKIYRFFLDQF